MRHCTKRAPLPDPLAPRTHHGCLFYTAIRRTNQKSNPKWENTRKKKEGKTSILKRALLKSIKNEHQQLFVWQRCRGAGFQPRPCPQINGINN